MTDGAGALILDRKPQRMTRRDAPQDGKSLGFRWRIDSSAQAVSIMLLDLRGRLGDAAHPAAAGGSWEIVLAEALNNVVEHAYSDRKGHAIEIALDFVADRMHADIRDDGRAMPDLALPKGQAPDLGCSLGDLPEGGFGWNLIRTLTAELAYNRDGRTNHLRFSVDLGG